MQWADRIGRRLKPRDLHVFMAVAERGSMADAAESLAISRPVVSRTIAQLEHALGVPLLDRTPQGVEPTLYGRALLRRCAAIFDEMRQSVKELEFLANPEAGELRIGCSEVMAAGLVPAIIDRLSREHPRLVFHMEIGAVPTLQSQTLRDRRCEFVIARMADPVPPSDMEAEILFYEPLRIVCGPQNRCARRRKVALAELVDEPWIIAPVELAPGSPFIGAFHSAGLSPPRAKILSNSVNLRHSLLATGRYITVMPGSILQFSPEPTRVRALPVQLPRWHLPTAVITLKNRALSPIAELFIRTAREMVEPFA